MCTLVAFQQASRRVNNPKRSNPEQSIKFIQERGES
jgi:hypothetical protein